MPTCLPRAASSSSVAPALVPSTIDIGRLIPAPVTPSIPAPATPPVLAALAAAHRAFVARKTKERDLIAWIEAEAAAVDRRAERKRAFVTWAVQQAREVDRERVWNIWKNDPTIDLE